MVSPQMNRFFKLEAVLPVEGKYQLLHLKRGCLLKDMNKNF